jgi:signal transduction histidine kinase
MISADPTQIQQVLINLCSNAVHAMEENGGILTIRLDDTVLLGEMSEEFREVKPGRYIRLTVADNGHGISPDIRQRIFDPYFTTKEIGKGTGIGLASVHGIVKNHDGAISVQSEPGKGSKMSLIFPATDEADI